MLGSGRILFRSATHLPDIIYPGTDHYAGIVSTSRHGSTVNVGEALVHLTLFKSSEAAFAVFLQISYEYIWPICDGHVSRDRLTSQIIVLADSLHPVETTLSQTGRPNGNNGVITALSVKQSLRFESVLVAMIPMQLSTSCKSSPTTDADFGPMKDSTWLNWRLLFARVYLLAIFTTLR